MLFHLRLSKILFSKINISELTSIVSDNKNQNNNSMKTIKVEKNDLDESISTEKNNSNEKNKQNATCIKAIKVELNDLNETISTKNSNFIVKYKGMYFK